MDKSWINISKKSDDAYVDGIIEFITFAKQNAATNNNKIWCPCKKCNNYVEHHFEVVESHLATNGMTYVYTQWIHHGETFDNSSTSSYLNHTYENDENFNLNEATMDMINDVYPYQSTFDARTKDGVDNQMEEDLDFPICNDGDYIASLPLVDPLDAYYVLNPNNDLPDALIESWLGEKKLKGISGSIPKSEDWIAAMKNHDLFLYFGHGSGIHLIRFESIAKLEICAATVLMGCSSGSLELNSCYAPRGAPITYLLAGSPIVAACLWDISSKDINRFGKEFITACWQERSNPDTISIGGSESSKTKYEHRRTMGLFMDAAREACISRFLTGAAVFCYGVPTAIRGKN